jgi:hypothetical protein
VVKNCHTIVSGPNFTGIAQFGNVATNRGGGGGGGTSGSGRGSGSGGRGKWCPPPPEIDNELSSDDSDNE